MKKIVIITLLVVALTFSGVMTSVSVILGSILMDIVKQSVLVTSTILSIMVETIV